MKIIKLSIFSTMLIVALFFLGLNYFNNKNNCYSKNFIVKNYVNNKKNFINLINYVNNNNLTSFTEIEFLNKNNIRCYLYEKATNSTSVYLIDFVNYNVKHIEILPNKSIKLFSTDTIFTIYNWVWDFEGNENTIGYESVLNHIGLGYDQIDSLRTFTSKIKCKSIEIRKNGDIFLRFCGVPMCQVRYIISKNDEYLKMGYTIIDDGIYFGLYKSGMFCGNCSLDE